MGRSLLGLLDHLLIATSVGSLISANMSFGIGYIPSYNLIIRIEPRIASHSTTWQIHNRCLPYLDDQSTYLQFGVLPINSIVHIKQGGGLYTGGGGLNHSARSWARSHQCRWFTINILSARHYETFHSAFASQLNQWGQSPGTIKLTG